MIGFCGRLPSVPISMRHLPRFSPRALTDAEQQTVLTCLHEDRFQDSSPAQVYATLLDEGQFHCSIRTMYRLLEQRGENRERRDQLTHPPYQKPELLATQANQLWIWDITKLRGPAKWTCYHLYVILDVFSRFVVGWMIAYRESAELAKRLIDHSCSKQLIAPGQLTIHADRGSSMKSKPVALLLADLGVTKTHSRPHVFDDNPYSESQFRTLKYRPGFPDRFGSIEDARGFCQSFFRWYNYEPHHSGLGLMTPAVVHLGRCRSRSDYRRITLADWRELAAEKFLARPVNDLARRPGSALDLMHRSRHGSGIRWTFPVHISNAACRRFFVPRFMAMRFGRNLAGEVFSAVMTTGPPVCKNPVIPRELPTAGFHILPPVLSGTASLDGLKSGLAASSALLRSALLAPPSRILSCRLAQ